jgi:hypothetical protein
MNENFVVPTEDERNSKESLVGWRITIYWDGDDAFYPCRVMSYDPATGQHNVQYENDNSSIPYAENLTTSNWKAWRGSDDDYAIMLASMVGRYLLSLSLRVINDDILFLSLEMTVNSLFSMFSRMLKPIRSLK